MLKAYIDVIKILLALVVYYIEYYSLLPNEFISLTTQTLSLPLIKLI